MGYIVKTRVGYHEVDRNRELTLPAMIDLFQDVGGFHGADCGFSNRQLADNGLAWIVSSWQLKVDILPKLDEHIVLETYPVKYKFCTAYRHFILRSERGAEYLKANSIWLLMDMRKYAPVKIPSEMQEAYGKCEELTGGYDFGGRKITAAKSGEQGDMIMVDRFMIDTNGHVNNKEYVRLSGCLLPEGTAWNFFRAEYTKQAREGDVLIPVISREEDRTLVALDTPDGEHYFTGEWSVK